MPTLTLRASGRRMARSCFFGSATLTDSPSAVPPNMRARDARNGATSDGKEVPTGALLRTEVSYDYGLISCAKNSNVLPKTNEWKVLRSIQRNKNLATREATSAVCGERAVRAPAARVGGDPGDECAPRIAPPAGTPRPLPTASGSHRFYEVGQLRRKTILRTNAVRHPSRGTRARCGR
jgi:hypothetical protein